ncbi:MAG: prepilin-type N-terminal cleavage/methylation domain-containing protein, partial [Patescibacteria group bacterium]
MPKNKQGFSLIEILIVVGVVGLVLTILVVSLNSKQKDIRDNKRLADMQNLGAALGLLKNETGGYDQSYCEQKIVSVCAANDNSKLLKIMPTLGQLNDPKFTVSCNQSGACAKGCNYSFSKLESQDFEVRFYLDKGLG